MIKPRWRKVLRDLWGNKLRTLLVIFSIAIGVFALGTIISTQHILAEDLARSYAATNPGSAVLLVDGFDIELLDVVARVPGVAVAEARRTLPLRFQTGPDEWQTINIDVLADFADLRLSQITPVSGAWPPEAGGVLVERASLPLMGLAVGDTLLVETAVGKQRELKIEGLYHDIHKLPAQFIGETYGAISVETLAWLGYTAHFDRVYITVEGDNADTAHVRAVADAVGKRLEKSGLTVNWIWMPEPGVHPANDYIQPLLLLLGVLGALSLFASAFLIINIINSLLTQHVQQIGMMKAIGARSGQIAQMYLVSVLILGLLAFVIAVPLSGWGAYALASYIASLVNFDLSEFYMPVQAIVIQAVVALIVPILAALYPILKGSRLTVREAISDYGLGKGHFGTHILDRAVEWVTTAVPLFSRPMRISLRNSVRRKSRLLLTLLTLTLGGAVFISVLSVQASFLATLDDALNYFNYDVELYFAQPHRVAEIQRKVMQVPGVVGVESWINTTGRRVNLDGREGESVAVLGIPAETKFIQPTLLEGRWLLPADENAVVINTQLLREEPDLKVGNWVQLKLNGRNTQWQVVGLVQGVMTGPIAYMNQPYLARALHMVGRSSTVQVIAAQHNPAAQTALVQELKAHFDNDGMSVNRVQTNSQIRETVTYQFGLVVTFLTLMAILIAAVGGLGLMGTMSINVLERTREIGVMRAVGASNGAILRIILLEGLFVGVISWVLSVIFAYPLGYLLSNAVGFAFLESPLTYHFAINGTFIWLVTILLIAALASAFPAYKAARLTVRETLAYE
jgi:putative ABC transport system permease protein